MKDNTVKTVTIPNISKTISAKELYKAIGYQPKGFKDWIEDMLLDEVSIYCYSTVGDDYDLEKSVTSHILNMTDSVESFKFDGENLIITLKVDSKDFIYCSNCKYLNEITCDGYTLISECKHPNNTYKTVSYYESRTWFKKEPKERNSNNRCSLYKPTLLTRVLTIFDR